MLAADMTNGENLPAPVSPPTQSKLEAAVTHLVVEHKKTDPSLRTALPDIVKAVADHLRVPQEQVQMRRSEVEGISAIRS